MSSTLSSDHPAHPSLPEFRSRDRIVESRLKPKRMAALTSVAGIALASALVCVGGFAVLDATVGRHPAVGDARSPGAGARNAVEALGSKLVGRWISDAGRRILVSKSGAIWADDGDLLGEATVDARDATRLEFKGSGFRCSYQVTFDGADSANWLLTSHSPGTPCPSGKFSRPFIF